MVLVHNFIDIDIFEFIILLILFKDELIMKFKETKQGSEIVFTYDFSKNINGVKLFETISKISSDIELRYLKGSIIIKFTNKKEWLNQVLQVLRKDFS